MGWLEVLTNILDRTKKNSTKPAVHSKPNHHEASAAEVIGDLSQIQDPLDLVAKTEAILLSTDDPQTRHFTFNYLEKALYRLREEPGRLEQFEEVCLRHHSEIQSMLSGLRAYDGHLPVIPMYKQMAIYKEKAGDFEGAIDWSERGLALYRADCVKPDYEEDLRKRISRMKSKRDV